MSECPQLWKNAVVMCVVFSSLNGFVCAGEDSETGPVVQRVGKVVIEKDVPYGRSGDRVLKLDVIRPAETRDETLPVIVFIHGGAWVRGDKSQAFTSLYPFAETGEYFTVSIGYRLLGEAPWPAQIHDCKAAIRWLRANAKQLHLNPNRIGVWSGSAGAHLASLIGTSHGVKELEGNCGSPEMSSHVTCVVDSSGPSDFLAREEQRAANNGGPVRAPRLVGDSNVEWKERAKQASPVTHVSKNTPPFLILHGTNDETVPIEQAEIMHRALRKAKVNSTFVRIGDGGHNFACPDVTDRITAFFDRHLRDRDVAISDKPIKEPRLVAVEALAKMVGSWEGGLYIHSFQWGPDKQCLIGPIGKARGEPMGTTMMRFDPVTGGISWQQSYPSWGVRDNRFTEISETQWRGKFVLTMNNGAVQTAAVLLDWIGPSEFRISYTNHLVFGEVPREDSAYELKRLLPSD